MSAEETEHQIKTTNASMNHGNDWLFSHSLRSQGPGAGNEREFEVVFQPGSAPHELAWHSARWAVMKLVSHSISGHLCGRLDQNAQ